MQHRCRPTVEALEARDNPSPTAVFLFASSRHPTAGKPVEVFARVVGGDYVPGSLPAAYGDQVTFLDDRLETLTVPVINGVAEITYRPHPGRNLLSATYSGAIYATAPPPFGLLLGRDDPSGTGFPGLVLVARS